MQNILATSVLAFYPIIALCFFALYPFKRALLLTVLIAQLLLPVGAFIKFDQIPQFDKMTIPSICLVVACVLSGRLKLPLFRNFGVVSLFAIMFLIGPVITSELNSDSMRFGPLFIPGVGLYDAISALVISVITLVPYFVARTLLRDENDHREMMKLLVACMLVYSIPLLIEVRLSPQFHYWVYGFYPSDFAQSIRGEGFRPMVFMGHGLIAAQFVVLALLAAATLWKTRASVIILSQRTSLSYRSVAVYLTVLLLFCRSLGASIYGFTLGPLILLSAPKHQIRLAACLVFLAILYPSLRYANLIPTEILVEMTNSASADRAQSLNYRFDNEQILLEHAAERPIFGWGRYGRNRVYDADTGRDLTVTDGEWIITLGQFGAIGFIAQFGLLSISVFKAVKAFHLTQTPAERIYLASLSLMVAISIFDLLPNAGLLPWTWLMAGALLGRAEELLKRSAVAKRAPQPKPAIFGLPYGQRPTPGNALMPKTPSTKPHQ